jgi:two-component system phosphate regulon sensor histidine kinase PhoR
VKQKINGRLLFIALLSMGLTLLLSVVVFKTAFEKQVKGDVRQSAEVMAAGYTAQPSGALLNAYAAAGYRITLIRSDGTVLYDSQGDVQTMENHKDRPEVASALQSGSGEAVRTSATLGYNTYYYAIALPDGTVLRAAKDTASLYLLYNWALPWLFLIVLALVGLSVVLSAYLTRKVVGPIEAMAEHFDEDEPDLPVPYPELAPFAATLKNNQMRLKENERIRQEFTANVSHELKTPMTSISGYAEMIETGLAKPEDVRSFAGKIRFEASRLISLIGDIILLSELDDPDSARKFGPVDLLPVAKNAIEYLSFNARKNNIKLSVTGEHLKVRGSQGLLEELIYTLCDNAIRYNRPGGKVVVDVSGRDGRVWLSVSDTGIGIPPEHQDRIFERFYRVDKSHSKETGGTGLGLAIVKHIAISHGGKITVRSKVDVGTQIKVSFPAFQDQPFRQEKPAAPGAGLQ